MSRYPGLNWEIVQRIEDLIRLKAWYESGNDDKHNHLPNIKAIITAYESKKLLWNMGLVTYWWGGVQRSQPRPFRVDEFWCLVKAAGKESIWVEGVSIALTENWISRFFSNDQTQLDVSRPHAKTGRINQRIPPSACSSPNISCKSCCNHLNFHPREEPMPC